MLCTAMLGASGASDSFLITSAEGRLQLVGGVRLGSGTPNARLEKGVDAHRGACLSGRWSHDGAGIVTGGEDGAVKIWSRSGMLRYKFKNALFFENNQNFSLFQPFNFCISSFLFSLGLH